MAVRPAVFAGSWYPAQSSSCKQQIEQFLSKRIDRQQLTQGRWMGGIVPHAGWHYSGDIACNVINLLKEAAALDLVILFGMHLHAGSANVMMTHGAWQTPFGELAVAEELAETLVRQFDFQIETPGRFNPDNTIELQLPFIKYLLDPKTILAIGVPPNSKSFEIGRAAATWAMSNNQRFRIIGSTDLTHYGRNYGFSPKGSGARALNWVRDLNDRGVIDAMLAMDPDLVLQEGIGNQNACCAGAAATAIAALKHMGAGKADTVAYATSHDKSPGDSFVGYAGMVFG